jgi:hypothetical protein
MMVGGNEATAEKTIRKRSKYPQSSTEFLGSQLNFNLSHPHTST